MMPVSLFISPSGMHTIFPAIRYTNLFNRNFSLLRITTENLFRCSRCSTFFYSHQNRKLQLAVDVIYLSALLLLQVLVQRLSSLPCNTRNIGLLSNLSSFCFQSGHSECYIDMVCDNFRRIKALKCTILI